MRDTLRRICFACCIAAVACNQAMPTGPNTFLATLQPRAPVSQRPFGVAISSTGVMLVTMQDTTALTRFGLPALTPGVKVPVGMNPGDVVFSADGHTAFTTNVAEGSVSRVNVAGNSSTSFPITGTPFRLLLSSDQARLYVSTSGGMVEVHNAATGAFITRINATSGAANGLTLSANGTRLFVSSVGGELAEINTGTNTRLRVLPLGGTLQDIVLSPDGTELYVANESGTIKVVRLADGAQIDAIPVHFVFALRGSPNGKWLVASRSLDGEVVVINRQTRGVVRTFAVGGTPRRIAFSADGATIAVANEANGVDVIR